MRSPGPLFIVSSRGPRSNTHTAWPSPVRATTSTADIDLSHFHNYCYAERNRNTHACRVPTHGDAWWPKQEECSHDCEHGKHECSRHNGPHGGLLSKVEVKWRLHPRVEPARSWFCHHGR